MATLSSAIVRQQVASMQDVEEALARQVLYGGDLATNLLEVATVSEGRLTEVIGHCYSLPAVPGGPLARPTPSTLRLVPADLAIRHGMYPIGERPGELFIAVAEPIPAEVESDLAFALGVNIMQQAALLVRVREAIARDYSAPLERRLERLVGKLDGTAPPSGGEGATVTRAASGTLGLPRPDTLPPRAYPPAPELPLAREPALDAALLRGDSYRATGGDGDTVRRSLSATPGSGAIRPAPVVNVTAETRAEVMKPPPSPEPQPGPQPPPSPAAAPRRTASGSLVATDPGANESTSPPLRSEPPPPVMEAAPGASAPPNVAAAENGSGHARSEERHATQPSLRAPSLPTPPRQEQAAAGAAALARLSQPPGSLRPRARRGPYTIAMAEQDLQAAASRDDILRACFEFCAQFFEYTAIFTVQGELAEGRDAQGAGADRDAVAGLAVPLGVPSVFAAARQAGTWVLGRVGEDGLDANLAQALRRPTGKAVLVLPIVIRERCVLLLWGDHGDDDVALEAIGEVISFAALSATALERLILERKRASRRAVAVRGALEEMPNPLVARGRSSRVPPAAQRAQALTAALERAPVDGADAPRPGAPPAASLGDVAHDIHNALTPAAPPAVRASWTEPTSPIVVGASPRFVPDDPTAAVGLRATPAGRHQTTPGVAPPAGGAPRPPRTDSTPDISIGVEEVDEAWGLDGESDTGVPLAPASRAVHVEPSALRRRQSSHELRLPSVIVNVESDARHLIARLVAGDTTAADTLFSMGESAIPDLVAAFPGPIVSEPRASMRDGPLPSRAGPLLQLLARFGRATVPYLVVRSADVDSEVRAWTARLLGELHGAEAARAVARRCTDDDERVRQAAISGARLLQRDAESRTALRESLVAMATDAQIHSASRHASIEALGRIGDPAAVPALIAMLTDARPDLATSVRWSLVSLTLQDFAADLPAWRDWWGANGARHRIEWLTDALTHDNQEIRHAAGDELKVITREYFGYYDDLPRGERERAQERYREWWKARGRALFS